MTRALDAPLLEEALARLRGGGVVAAATETFFGLLADARDPKAVDEVVRLKGRQAAHPIAVLVPDRQTALSLAGHVPDAALRWTERYWPGPLTLVLRLRRPERWPAPLLGPGGTLGVRVPGSSVAADVLAAFGGALTATSANRTGQPPLRGAEAVRAVFGDDVLVLPGEAPGGAPSTVVDVSGMTPRLLRAGAVAAERLVGLDRSLPGG